MSRLSLPAVLSLAAAACALAAVTAPALAGDWDDLVYLSWSADAVVDTLVVAEAGSHDLWVLVLADRSVARFIETTGVWRFGAGLTVTDFAVLTVGDPVGNVTPGAGGQATVRIGDFECWRGADPLAIARLTVAIDPAQFAAGRAAVVPSPTDTRLTFAEHDPDVLCIGGWDLGAIGPVTVLDAALPAAAASFGALKARYR